MSHFSFPSTPILHECTVHNQGKYFSTHKIIRKNLQTIAKVVSKVVSPELTISTMTSFDHVSHNLFLLALLFNCSIPADSR